jgi:lysophospholipase L1-like esterase
MADDQDRTGSGSGVTLSRSRRAALGLLMAAGVAGFAEAGGALAWFFGVPRGERETVERILGLRGSRADSVLRFAPHPYFNFLNNPEYTTPEGRRLHHPVGIRASGARLFDKPPGTLRIVALGASTTYGYYFDDAADVWPALLEARLRRRFGGVPEVINCAVPGHTAYEMIGMAAMWLPEFRPDLVLLTVGINDAFAVGYPDEGGPDNTTFRHAWTYRPPPRWVRAAMRRSYFARGAGRSWLARGGLAAGDLTLAMQHPLPPAPALAGNIGQATGRYFRRNLETLVLLARHAGATPILVTNPLNPARETGLGAYYDAVSAAIRRNNAIIADLARRENLPFIDLHAAVRDPGLFRDAVHVNARGMALTAEVIGAVVEPLAGARLAPGPSASR